MTSRQNIPDPAATPVPAAAPPKTRSRRGHGGKPAGSRTPIPPGARRPSIPAGGATADGVPPAGSTEALSGAEWQKAVKAAQSRQAGAARNKATRYLSKAARGAGDQFRPGMSRRLPPGGGDAA